MKNNMKLTYGALIAALYVVLTLISQALGLASGVIQLRISEALTLLPIYTSAAVPGLFVGCIIANIVTGCAIWDTVFGSLATLSAALLTYRFAKEKVWLAPVFPIAINSLVIPAVLQYAYGAENSYIYLMLTVLAGETISCGLLGVVLTKAIKGKIEWPK